MSGNNYSTAPPSYGDNSFINKPINSNNGNDGSSDALLGNNIEGSTGMFASGMSGLAGDSDLPDDFKYSSNVAECTISVRNAFIRRVYAVLFGQITITTIVGAIMKGISGLQEWAFNNMWMFYTSIGLSFLFLILTQYKSRSYPHNFIFVGLFTLFESYSIGLVVTLYDNSVVLGALVITMLVFAGLTLLACQSKYDFTYLNGFLAIGLFGLIGSGFVAMFLPYSNTFDVIYSIIGTLVFSGYILVDTQIMMRHLHPDQVVEASVKLYLDCLNLFLNILRLLGNHSRD